MNLHLTLQPLCQRKGALGVVTLRNSHALFILRKACALSLTQRGLDGPRSLMEEVLKRNLLRPELISAFLAQIMKRLSRRQIYLTRIVAVPRTLWRT